jgi:hypothetical protein
VLLLGHPQGAVGQAVHGAAGDVGGEAAPGRELGGLVVGEVEGGGGVGLGEEAQGGGLAGAGEGDDAQRAGGVGAPGVDDGLLLGGGSQEVCLRPRLPRRRPRIGRPPPVARAGKVHPSASLPSETRSRGPGGGRPRRPSRHAGA